MDLNMPTTIVNNQENQLLLNAIKNKFATQTVNETTAAFSPPKFNIPCLKIPTNATETTTRNDTENTTTLSTTPLNQFLLKQLQQQHSNDKGLSKERNTGFVLPQLQLGNKLHKDAEVQTKLELPLLKSSAAQTPISSLTAAVQKLQVGEASTLQNIPIPTTPAIDLTTALASKLAQHQGTPPTRDFNNKPNISEDFDIPFIDCDRLDVSRIILATANEYCLTDISQLALRPSKIEPSCIGRVLNFDNKYVAPLPLKCFSDEYQHQHVKHTIVPFQFDTKSPDDIVLESLSKFHRRYFN